jgi:hypothetical protein
LLVTAVDRSVPEISGGCRFGFPRATDNYEVIVMSSTLLASPQESAQSVPSPAVSTPNTDRAIAMSIALNADARRIAQALTMPEYLEAWIAMPDQGSESSIVATQKANGYRLDHCRGRRVIASVVGSFLCCHQRKMRMLWCAAWCPELAESLVDFRIRGNFGSSILELRHTGFRSTGEFLWHHQLWRASLAKLSVLLGSA